MLVEPVTYCCRGYCIDLLKQLALKKNFTASLALSPDGQFGSFITRNGTSKEPRLSNDIHFHYALNFCNFVSVVPFSKEGMDGLDWGNR